MQTSRRTSTILLLFAAVAVGVVVTWLWYQARHSPEASAVVEEEARTPGATGQTEDDEGGLGLESERSMAGVAARVGEETITVAEVDEQLGRARRSAVQRGATVDWKWLEARRAEIVERRIEQVALLQLAEKRGVEVSEEMLAEAVETEVSDRFGDRATFQKWLARRHLSEEEFALQVRERLIRDALLADAEVPEPDEASLRRLYSSRRGVLHAPARARVDLVTILAKPHAHSGHRRAQQAKASKLATKLSRGEWPEESAEVRVHKNEWLMVPTLPIELQGALAVGGDRVAKGDRGVIGPIVSSSGLHVFRIHEYRPPGLMPFEEARDTLREKALEDTRKAVLKSLTGESLAELEVQRLDQHWYRRALRKASFRRTANTE